MRRRHCELGGMVASKAVNALSVLLSLRRPPSRGISIVVCRSVKNSRSCRCRLWGTRVPEDHRCGLETMSGA